MDINKLISKLDNWEDTELARVLGRLILKLKNDPQNKDLLKYQRAIYDEFQKRIDNNFKGDRPEIGVLAICGYHVGNLGENKVKRRIILEFIMHNELPKISNPNYMNEWGLPNSTKRLKKLITSLRAFIDDKKKFGHKMDKAIREWEEDLKFIINNFDYLND